MSTEYSVQIFDTTGMLTHFQTVRSGLEGAKLVSSIIGTVRRTVRNETKAGMGWKFADADRIVIITKGERVKGTPFNVRKNLTRVIEIANVKY